jgi:hypothetical protein
LGCGLGLLPAALNANFVNRVNFAWDDTSLLTTEITEYTEVFPDEACLSYLVFGV